MLSLLKPKTGHQALSVVEKGFSLGLSFAAVLIVQWRLETGRGRWRKQNWHLRQ